VNSARNYMNAQRTSTYNFVTTAMFAFVHKDAQQSGQGRRGSFSGVLALNAK
jgi:hypothetical protein